MKKILLMRTMMIGITLSSKAEPCLQAYNMLIAAADSAYTDSINGCITGMMFAGPESIMNINCTMDAYWAWSGGYDNTAYGLDACTGQIH